MTIKMGTRGLYFEIKRAVLPLVVSAMMADAFCSKEAETAAQQTVSVVAVGRGVSERISENKGG